MIDGAQEFYAPDEGVGRPNINLRYLLTQVVFERDVSSARQQARAPVRSIEDRLQSLSSKQVLEYTDLVFSRLLNNFNEWNTEQTDRALDSLRKLPFYSLNDTEKITLFDRYHEKIKDLTPDYDYLTSVAGLMKAGEILYRHFPNKQIAMKQLSKTWEQLAVEYQQSAHLKKNTKGGEAAGYIRQYLSSIRASVDESSQGGLSIDKTEQREESNATDSLSTPDTVEGEDVWEQYFLSLGLTSQNFVELKSAFPDYVSEPLSTLYSYLKSKGVDNPGEFIVQHADLPTRRNLTDRWGQKSMNTNRFEQLIESIREKYRDVDPQWVNDRILYLETKKHHRLTRHFHPQLVAEMEQLLEIQRDIHTNENYSPWLTYPELEAELSTFTNSPISRKTAANAATLALEILECIEGEAFNKGKYCIEAEVRTGRGHIIPYVSPGLIYYIKKLPNLNGPPTNWVELQTLINETDKRDKIYRRVKSILVDKVNQEIIRQYPQFANDEVKLKLAILWERMQNPEFGQYGEFKNPFTSKIAMYLSPQAKQTILSSLD